MSKKMSRRTFLVGAMGFCVACAMPQDARKKEQTVYLPGRNRLPNPYVENGKPIVVVVHGTEFEPMLAKGMEMLGGFKRFGSGKAVHLKPNFVAPSKYPVTTDGGSLITTLEFLQREGFTDITIAEWGSLSMTGRVLPTKAFQYYGLDEKAAKGGFKIKDLYNDKVVRVRDDRWTAMPNVGIYKSVYDTPMVINMPTIKQHSLLQFTCALKNTMGQIDRKSRLDMHRFGWDYAFEGREQKLQSSHLATAEIAAAVNCDLTIIDARYGIGKSHHFKSGGVSIKPDRIIISGDMLAADWAAANLLAEYYDGFQVEMARPHLDHAVKIGLGAAGLDDVIIKEVTV
jgi:uncharacterized protein (DUF362 family)